MLSHANVIYSYFCLSKVFFHVPFYYQNQMCCTFCCSGKPDESITLFEEDTEDFNGWKIEPGYVTLDLINYVGVFLCRFNLTTSM